MPYQLSARARETALRAARAMFPHDALPDEAYDKVVRAIEAQAAGDEGVAADIDQGIAQLDDPRPFAELDAGAQLEALERAEGSPFFELATCGT